MPVAAAARPDTISRSLWGPVTVRVAWELVLVGLQARPEQLGEAREHVLRSLPAGVGEHEAEELASLYVAEWLERRRDGRYRRVTLDEDLAQPLSLSWRHRLQETLDPLGEAVLRLHYGDGFSVEAVARSVAVDGSAVEAARGGIREAARTIAVEEGLSLRGWPMARLDGLISRIARLPEPGCPGPGGLLTEEGRGHADRCPRCSRTVRLVRSGILSPSDLFPPRDLSLRPAGQARVLALFLHPDGRKHQAQVAQALGGAALQVGSAAWLLPEQALEAIEPRLHELALAATPARHHLRGSLVTGSGRWIGARLLGPVAIDALDVGRSRPWGEVEGIAELPAPLPPPPKATRWWAAAVVLVALCAATASWVFRDRPQPAAFPVQASFRAEADGLQVVFDTDELAVVDIVTLHQGQLELYARQVREDKGRWADGDGAYRLKLPGEQALLITSPGGIPDLEGRLAAAGSQPDPLAALAHQLHLDAPDAGLARTPPAEP